MANLAQFFMIESVKKLNFSRKIKEVFLAARSNKFLQGKSNQFILCGKGGQFKGFVEKRFI